MSNKTVYIAMATDIVHNGHMNVIKEGAKYGEVTIGLLTDEAIATYDRLPLLDFESRKLIFENIKGVSSVVAQDTLDYTKNLETLKPDYVIHGDDWKTGVQSNIRAKLIETLAQWGGQLIEIPYTRNDATVLLDAKFWALHNTPDERRAKLRRLLKVKPLVRALEASNGLTGLIVENTKLVDAESAQIKEFDAMWISSLCDSTFKGKPDIELVDLTSRLNTINEIMEVTTKPIILDGDTGGLLEHFVFNVKTLERIGISAIIIEDKTGLKKNSLFGTEVQQTMDDPHNFAEKIRAGKQAQITRDFMIFARIESMIAGLGVDDAFMRAKIYIEEGNADGIMMHSKEKDGAEIIEFLRRFRAYSHDIPVIVVPTTYNYLKDEELAAMGANIVIHANHLLRSAYPAMKKTAEVILASGRSKEADELCMSVSEILRLIPGGE